MNRDSALLLLTALIWGSTFVAVKQAVAEASPVLFVGVRFLLAAISALVLVRRGPRLKAAILVGIPIGVVYGLGYTTQTIGLTLTTPARSAFLTGLSVALVPFWALLVSRVRPGIQQVGGLLLTIPGLWLLTSSGGMAGAWNRGDTWTLLCAVLFALHIALVGRFAGKHDSAGLLFGQLATTAVLALIASPLVEAPHMARTPQVLRALALTAFLATTFTTWIQLRCQPRVGSNRTALIFATEPVFGALFSRWLYGEQLPILGWAGGGLILAGMVLSETGPNREAAPGDRRSA